MLVQDVVASAALHPAADQVAAVWRPMLMLSPLLRRFRGSVGLDGGVAWQRSKDGELTTVATNSSAIVAGRSGQLEHALAMVRVVEVSRWSRGAAEIKHPSRETKTGLFGAHIQEYRQQRRNRRSALTNRCSFQLQGC